MKFKKYLIDGVSSDQLTIITIEVRDPDNSLGKFLEELKCRANPGHSFSVLMDKEGDNPISIGFDGDGSFFVGDIDIKKPIKENY
jgi:hypothetical protein